MTDKYKYDPDTWPPGLAGIVAGAVAAIAAAIIGRILTTIAIDSPHKFTNSLTIVIAALVIGSISGNLWRKLRATDNARTMFGWTMAGGFVATVAAVLIADQTVLRSLAPYAVPLVAIVFITLAFFTPLLSTVRSPRWVATLPVLLSLAIGIGLFV